MDKTELKDKLNQELNNLSIEQLQQVYQFVENLQTPVCLDESEQRLIEKWEYLIKHEQELDPKTPLNDKEISQIRQILSKLNQCGPIGLAEGDFTTPDNFNDSLPDEIVNSFY